MFLLSAQGFNYNIEFSVVRDASTVDVCGGRGELLELDVVLRVEQLPDLDHLATEVALRGVLETVRLVVDVEQVVEHHRVEEVREGAQLDNAVQDQNLPVVVRVVQDHREGVHELVHEVGDDGEIPVEHAK